MTSALLSGTMTTLEAASYLGVSIGTMKRWRSEGGGPAFIALGERIIRYRSVDLDRGILSRKTNAE